MMYYLVYVDQNNLTNKYFSEREKPHAFINKSVL